MPGVYELIKHKDRGSVYRWIKSVLRNAKYRSKQSGLMFTLDAYELIENLNAFNYTCAYCQEELVFRTDIPDPLRRRASLDRVICELGYVTANLAVCCMRCNAIKQDAQIEDLKRLLKSLETIILERPLLAELYG